MDEIEFLEQTKTVHLFNQLEIGKPALKIIKESRDPKYQKLHVFNVFFGKDEHFMSLQSHTEPLLINWMPVTMPIYKKTRLN